MEPVNISFDANIVQCMKAQFYCISLRVGVDEDSQITVICRTRGGTHEGRCNEIRAVIDAISLAADYKVMVSSSTIKMEANEEGPMVSAIWLGDVDVVFLVVWVKGVVSDEPWRVDSGCRYVSL